MAERRYKPRFWNTSEYGCDDKSSPERCGRRVPEAGSLLSPTTQPTGALRPPSVWVGVAAGLIFSAHYPSRNTQAGKESPLKGTGPTWLSGTQIELQPFLYENFQ